MIKCIACVDKNLALGRTNKETGKAELLFNIPADMAHFKAETTGKMCIFGYTTYQSLKYRPLKDRMNVVLWNEATSLTSVPGAVTFCNFGDLLRFAKTLSNEYLIFVCGGASLYKQFITYCDELDLTVVDETVSDADAFFPDPKENRFTLKESTPFQKEDGPKGTNGYSISRQIWTKL